MNQPFICLYNHLEVIKMKLLKKRIPALFLVLLVVLSLTVPALAAASPEML